MKATSITIRTDKEFKDKCDSLFSQLGMTTQMAINTFLHQAVRENGMPFVPRLNRDTLVDYVNRIPEAGRIDENNNYILPSDWNDAEDDVYERLV